MKKLGISFFLLFFFFLGSTQLYGDGYTLHVGPVSLGTGGPNPISIPPINPVEYEFIWIRHDDEFSFSISPGFFYGKRMTFSWGSYVSLGGGLVIDANGVGLGPYSAFGWDWCGSSFCFNAEYKKAIGVTAKHIISPYAVRIGVTIPN